ncbi:hypothetical protein LXM94_23920 [Rhizobium sp. TRM95111]|uniref:hypothetical protein n=1 Tax=Rhizobium alarense TaxID=2846851 RepID=UPI001F35710D|nr:hypothetical protein [Rhizobium alarense]MCF3643012.1 hypothetical protein [Rhizobium alarense]
MDSLTFGTGLDHTVSGTADFSSTELGLASQLFEIGFSPVLDDTSSAGGTGDLVHDLIYGLMTGTAADDLEAVFDADSIVFNGSDAGDETFVGGARADQLYGNCGNDVLSGAGGADI